MPNLKIYGWNSFRPEAAALLTPGGNRNTQTREIMAAKSAAEVKRKAGLTRTEWEHSGCETGNHEEQELAMSDPGVIFWCLRSDKFTLSRPRWFRDGEIPRPDAVDI